jgi:hypothetical protein
MQVMPTSQSTLPALEVLMAARRGLFRNAARWIFFILHSRFVSVVFTCRFRNRKKNTPVL